MMHKITFRLEAGAAEAADSAGGELIVGAEAGESLISLAQNNGIYIDAPCSGNGTCGKCRVRLESGEVDMTANTHLASNDYEEGWRLACQSRVAGDATILVPASAKAFMRGMRTADFSSEEELRRYDTMVSQVFELGFNYGASLRTEIVTLDPPTLDDTMPDNERLINAVMELTGSRTVYMSNRALTMMPDILRDNNFTVKCLMRMSKRYLSILEVSAPDDDTPLCGIAIDIGTTTVSAALLDLTTGRMIARGSSGNAQIRFGADVINRIIQADRPGGRLKLMDAIRLETINPLIQEICGHAGINPARVARAVIASNTTMNHLYAGVPASSIRLEPYIPVFRELPGMTAQEFDMPIHPEARVVFAPNVGSYVGGDITAGTFVTTMWSSPEPTLFIDLGTNGELVFGSEDYLLCCACSAGPAFEGGDISCGMRATDGAIESCQIDSETMEPTLKVVGDSEPVGICGSGIIDTISELFRCGIIDSRGKFCREGERVRRDEFQAYYILAFPTESSNGVEMSEVDIDNFVRAKGAIYSAINSMLATMDMTKDDIGRVYIAGGIGSGINIEKAIGIGMLPNLPLDRYSYIGNSSLTGACAMLLSVEAERQVQLIGRNMTYLELSSHPGYMDEFVAACFLPHTDASLFPKLK